MARAARRGTTHRHSWRNTALFVAQHAGRLKPRLPMAKPGLRRVNGARLRALVSPAEAGLTRRSRGFNRQAANRNNC